MTLGELARRRLEISDADRERVLQPRHIDQKFGGLPDSQGFKKEREMALTFPRQIRDWDLRRNVVNFLGDADGSPMPCTISMGALVDHFGAGKGGKRACLAAFDQWHLAIEQKASEKYAAQDRTVPLLLRRTDFA